MAKPSLDRLQSSSYPWSFDIPPRFGDIDPLRHLNNAALARFYEDARIRFVDGVGVREALQPQHGFVVAEVAIQYLAEGGYPEVVTAACGALRLGRSSLTIGQALFQFGRCIGTAESTLVYVHRKEGGARPLPQAAGAALSAYPLPSFVAPVAAAPQTDPVQQPVQTREVHNA